MEYYRFYKTDENNNSTEITNSRELLEQGIDLQTYIEYFNRQLILKEFDGFISIYEYKTNEMKEKQVKPKPKRYKKIFAYFGIGIFVLMAVYAIGYELNYKPISILYQHKGWVAIPMYLICEFLVYGLLYLSFYFFGWSVDELNKKVD